MKNAIDLLIIKKVSGEKITDQEQEVLEAWLESHPGNRKIYLQMKLSFSQEAPAKLDEYRDEIWTQIRKPVPEAGRKPIVLPFLRWAAVVLLVLISGLSWWLLNDHSPAVEKPHQITFIEKISLPGQKMSTVLPDGTRVKLNSGSKLIVPDEFVGDTREVQLIGEAFFDVKRDESKPFVIVVNNFEVKVLGTSFNISAYPERGSNHVAVKTGKVSVNGKSKNPVELTPSQMIQINETGELQEITSYDADLVFGWTDQKLVFKDNTFKEVISEIERWYNVDIVVEDDVKANERFTGTFQNATVKEVILSVTKAYKLNFKTIDNEIIIDQNRI